MRNTRKVLAVALAVGGAALGAPPQAQAQQPGEWWEWAAPLVVGGQELETRRGRVVVPDRRPGTRERRARGGRQGPPFCRNGKGHPVHGREWCVRQGFGLGRDYDPRWERRRWEDVVFRSPRDRRRSGALDEVTLADVLGSVVFGRLQAHGRQLGAGGPLTGRWAAAEGNGRVLQLRAGGIPVAELTDLTGDGHADVVLVYRRD